MQRKRRSKFVIKANGKAETFSTSKLTRSLARTGLPIKACERIANQISGEVRDGEKTGHIYKKALTLLKQQSPLAGIRYSLKKSLFELGPEGHYFEDYVERYFRRRGFESSVCQILPGKFVKHEVDCIAVKNNERYFSECKFHNHSGTKNDVKISLYVKARWDDLKQGPEGKNLKGYFIFSNTAFTSDAILYANGTGLKLMGVNAPEQKSFLEEIKEMRLYPITSLRSLNRHQKKILLQMKIIVADEVTLDLLFKSGFDKDQISKIMDEVKLLKEGKI